MPYVNHTDGSLLTAESAKYWFRYEPDTGKLFRRMATGEFKELAIGQVDNKKRVPRIQYNGKNYVYTHIIWLIVYGRFPTGIVEHRDLIDTNNKLSNLREATQSQNMANISATKRSKSGIKGVIWDKQRNKWAVYIGKDYKCRNIGRFNSLDEAIAAHQKAHEELFGEFSRAN